MNVNGSDLNTPLLCDAVHNEIGVECGSSNSTMERLAVGMQNSARGIRVLKFGFQGNSSKKSWQWDPFKSFRGQSFGSIMWRILSAILPCIEWLRTYQLSYLKGDIAAGLSVGFMLIPQGMAYARVAGLPAVYGLYTGWAPSLLYALFGSSRQLALGPTSLVSLMVGETVRKIVGVEVVNEDDPLLFRYIGLTMLLALMVGSVQIFGGIVRLGWIVRFLSHAVVSGFSSGAAIIIGLTQMRYFLGYQLPRSDKVHIMVRDIFLNLDKIHYPSLIMASTALLFLLVMKHFGKTYKQLVFMRTLGPILCVLLGILFIFVSGNPWHIRVSGTIPKGTPKLFLDFPWLEWEDLITPSLIIGGAAYLESVGMAKAFAAKNGYSIDANQELVGLGVANVVGACFSAYPTGGSFSRTIVNNECGAKTGLAGVVAAMLIGFALVFFTPLFQLLPLPVLAAIVLSSVVGLVDHEEASFLLRVDVKDFIVWTLAFLGTLFFGIQVGVLVAVLISLAFVVEESANPQCEVQGRLPGTTVYRNVDQYPDAKCTPGIIVLRFHSPIYFANVSSVRESLRKYELHESQSGDAQKVKYVIIDMSSVSSVDSAACQAIMDIFQEYKARSIRLALINPNQAVMKTFERAGIPDLIGRSWFFVRVYDAVLWCKADMATLHRGATQASYPAFASLANSRRSKSVKNLPSADQSVGSAPVAISNLPAPQTDVFLKMEGAHSAPEVLQSSYVLVDNLESEVFANVPSVHVCHACMGMQHSPGHSDDEMQPEHVILAKCTCKKSDGLTK